MAQEEITGVRDLTYSAWHRRESTRRFVGIECAQTLSMIDLDASLYVEYDDTTKETLALIETARDTGQLWKTSTVTVKLAKRCFPTVEAYVLLYALSDKPNPANERYQDISGFRVMKLHPEPDNTWHEFTPEAWARALVKIRKRCAARIDDWHRGAVDVLR
jgi:hypothetical protein